MNDYNKVQEALAAGTDPALLCATCPWDRYCVSPPAITRAEIDQQMERAKQEDEALSRKARAEGRDVGLPVSSLMTAIVFGGKDMSAACCPVFALRLRSSDGRKIADATKRLMQKWSDE